MIKDN